MADDAEARFVIGFDGDLSGVNASKSGIEGLRATIEKGTASLKQMEEAMGRLKGTVEIQRWQALPKEIEKANKGVKDLEKEMGKAKIAFDKLSPKDQAGDKGAAIFKEALRLNQALGAARGNLTRLLGEQANLKNNAVVKQFKDLEAASTSIKGKLGQAQSALSAAGGDMRKATAPAKDLRGAFDELLASAGKQEGPIGGLARAVESFKGMKGAPIFLAIAAAIVAIGVAAIYATVKFLQFVAAVADASRSAGLLREAAAGSASGAERLDRSIGRVLGRVAATRAEVEGLALELRRAGLEGATLEATLSATAMAQKTMGDAAGATLRGLVERGRLTKRFWLGVLDLQGTGLATKDVAASLAKGMKISVGAAAQALRDGRVPLEAGAKALDEAVRLRFGAVAAKQMLALDYQLKRFKENWEGIFKGVDVEPALRGLKSILDMFGENHAVGQALRVMFKALFQPLINSTEGAAPLVEGLIWGIVRSMQSIVIVALRMAIFVKGALRRILPDVDALQVGFYVGMAAVVAFTVALGTLLAVVVAVGASIALLTAPIWLPLVGAIVLVYGLATAINWLWDRIEKGDWAAAGKAIIDGIIEGITKGLPGLFNVMSVKVAQGSLKAFTSSLQIQSPSRVFAAKGEEIPAGVEVGVDRGQRAVTQAVQRLARPEDMAMAKASAGPAGVGGSVPAISIGEVNYHGPGGRQGAREFALYLAEELELQVRAKGLVPQGAV